MNFIVSRFMRMLERDYGIEYVIDENTDKNSYIVILKKLDKEFKKFLLSVRYNPIVSQNNIKNSNGDVIKTEIIRSSEKICSPYGTNSIIINFTDDNYGEFIRLLDYNIRRYTEKHSQIDVINNRV